MRFFGLAKPLKEKETDRYVCKSWIIEKRFFSYGYDEYIRFKIEKNSISIGVYCFNYFFGVHW